MVAVGVAEHKLSVGSPWLSSPYQLNSDVPDFRTSRRRNLAFRRNVDYQCSLVAIICVPENHGAISETVHKEIDAAIECNKKVTNQKYLGTNRNFLQK